MQSPNCREVWRSGSRGTYPSLQKVALFFKERCSKLRVLSIYNSIGALSLVCPHHRYYSTFARQHYANAMVQGSDEELTSVFTTGFKREKTLDIKGYDYHSTPKAANKDDELLTLLAKEVRLLLRFASKLDGQATT